MTRGRFQFCAYYVDDHCLQIVQRDLNSGAVFRKDITGEFNLLDAHNSVSLGCDRNGFLHVAYDHHATQLKYRRSTAPLSIHSWTDELAMSGQYEGQVTYPAFLAMPNDQPLLLLYRDGTYMRGTARFKEYDESAQRWTDREPPVLSGTAQQPWTSNAYWNHPAIGGDGDIHLSFVWRTDSLPPDGRINNINVDYARSPDQGHSWYSSRNRQFQLPITQVNSETVHPVSPGSNLINQSSMALDAQGHPHITFYSDDPDGVPQYQHLWFDGRIWRHNFISQRTKAFVLAGGGTLQIPISRPEIVVDDESRVYVIYRGDLTDNRMVAQRLQPPHYVPDVSDVRVLWNEPLGFSEPVIDRLRWQRDRVLSMLIQKNHQPPHDAPSEPVYESIYLVDWHLPELWTARRASF
ncbi:MAG: BNR repeat-containing protein [Gammaproteobacteria bacterium]